MKALKILGIVFGILLLLTGGGLLPARRWPTRAKPHSSRSLTNSGYAGPVDGTVQSVGQSSPVIVTVSYTDDQGKQQTGQGGIAGGQATRWATPCRPTTARATRARSSVVNVPASVI